MVIKIAQHLVQPCFFKEISVCDLILVLFLSIATVSCWARVPGEGGFRVKGHVVRTDNEPVQCTLTVKFFKDGKVFKKTTVAEHFDEHFFASPDIHQYFFVIECAQGCYMTKPYRLGRREEIDLGKLSLDACK